MQLKDITIKDLKEGPSSGTCPDIKINNVFDPEQNINAGTCYLYYLIIRYKGDRLLALIAYNIGPTELDRQIQRNTVSKPHPYVQKVNQALYGERIA